MYLCPFRMRAQSFQNFSRKAILKLQDQLSQHDRCKNLNQRHLRYARRFKSMHQSAYRDQTKIPVRGRVVVLNCQRSRYADWWIWIDAPASARGREKSLELYSILWSDWPTSKQKVSRHGKSFCCSGSLTLFFGGREVTTRNTSAVRRLTTPSYHNKPKIRNSPTKLKRKSLLKALAFLARWLKRERKVKQPHWKTAVKFLSSLRALSKAKW